MNSASRIQDVLTKLIKQNPGDQLHVAWKKVFQVNSIFDVYASLSALKNELDRYTKELEYTGLLKPNMESLIAIETFLGTPNLQVQIQQAIVPLKGKPLHSLEYSSEILENAALKDEHSYSEEPADLEDFINKLSSLLDEVKSSEMEHDLKSIYISFIADLQKGSRLYEINGIDALITALQDSICKYTKIQSQLIGRYDKVKENTEFVIGEIVFWAKTLKKTTQSYKQLKSAMVGIIGNSDDAEDTEVVTDSE